MQRVDNFIQNFLTTTWRIFCIYILNPGRKEAAGGAAVRHCKTPLYYLYRTCTMRYYRTCAGNACMVGR